MDEQHKYDSPFLFVTYKQYLIKQKNKHKKQTANLVMGDMDTQLIGRPCFCWGVNRQRALTRW